MRLRVIAGELGGRFFDSPDSDATHPMSERMRGSLFNILGDIKGKTILDAFAGSGALSFEAVSRGAVHALTLEKDKIAQKISPKIFRHWD
jgi:16S rRNA (guanine966-N2)-methyltransferase